MKKEMLINCLQSEEIRIAILENGVLEELYVERASHESYVGNIYKGKIVNIEPSIQAAFVDFGVGRNGFLHVSDVEPAYYRHMEERGSSRRGDRGDRGGRGSRPQSRNYDDYDRPRRGGGGGFRQQAPEPIAENESHDRPIASPGYTEHPSSLDPNVPDIIVEEIIIDEDFAETEPVETPTMPEPSFKEVHQEPTHADETPSEEAAHVEPSVKAEPAHVEHVAHPAAVNVEHALSEESTHPAREAEAPPMQVEQAKTEVAAPEETATPPEQTTGEEGKEEESEEGKPKRKTRRGKSTTSGKSTTRSKKPRKRPAKDEGEGPSEEEPKPRPMDSSERRTDEQDASLGPIEPRPASDLRDEDLSFSMAPRTAGKPEPKPEARPEPKREAPFEPKPEWKAQPVEPAPQPEAEIVLEEPEYEDEDIIEVVEEDAAGRFEEVESLEERVEEEKALEEETEIHDTDDAEIAEMMEPEEEEGEGDGPIVDFEDEFGERGEYASREPNDRSARGRGRDRDRGRGRGGRDQNRRGGGRNDRRGGGRPGAGRPKPHIEDMFKRGQEVLVQVIKEGIGTKGPTLSTYISIAGRYLVLMPGLNRIGVSRKIDDEETRRRLREILNELKPPRGIGFIIRTAGQDRNKKELQSDLAYLLRLWEVVVRRIRKQKSPTEIYRESDMVTRTIRDIFTSDIDTIWVDERGAYEAAKEFMEAVMPRYAERIKFYEGTEPMFNKYGIENEMSRIQQRHIPLAHGGSIVIDQAEALVAIDVNSGNFRADNNNAEETAYQMNMHAAKEIARQLRLRDLGGVIVNDFIDMREERHRRGVERALRDAMRRDRARTKILRMSQFGIIEMTRQRIRPSLKRSAFQDCSHCHGTGHVKTCESVSIEVMRMLQLAVHREIIHRIEIRVHEEVAQYLQNRKRRDIVALEERGAKHVTIHTAGSAVTPEFLEFLCYDNNDNEVKFNVQEEPRPQRRRGY